MWHLTLTLTSDHINNVRNEFLRSDLYEKMVLRMNLALLLKQLLFAFCRGWPCWILTNWKSSPKIPAGPLSQISSVISWEPKTIVRIMIARLSLWQVDYYCGDLLFYIKMHVFCATLYVILLLYYAFSRHRHDVGHIYFSYASPRGLICKYDNK